MKKLKLNLKNATVLKRDEQKIIHGGNDCYNLGNPCSGHEQCGSQYCDLICSPMFGICVPA